MSLSGRAFETDFATDQDVEEDPDDAALLTGNRIELDALD